MLFVAQMHAQRLLENRPNTCVRPWAQTLTALPAVIWDALKAAAESDASTAAIILDSAGVTHNSDLSECYDERGRKYELPQYVLSEPSNLIRDKPAGSQVELMAR